PAAVTDGRAIEWHPNQRGRPTNDRAQGPTAHLERAPQLHLNSVLGARDLPRIAMTQPVVRSLLLPAVGNRLSEETVLISQPVPQGRQRHRPHRFEKTRREPA